MLNANTQGSADTHDSKVWMGSGSSRPTRFSLCCTFRSSTEDSQIGGPIEKMPAGLRPRSAGELHCKRDSGSDRIRAEEEVRSIPAIHLLQRASDRRHRR